MKTKNILILLALFSLSTFSFLNAKPEKHHLTFKVKGMENTMSHLGCYFGDKSYVIDSAPVDSKGRFSYAGDTALAGGVYFIILKNKNFFEFIIDKDQKFTLTTDTSDLVKNMKVTGSPENTLFYEYRNYAGSMYTNYQKYTDGIKSGPNKEASRKSLDSLNNALDKYKNDVIAKYPDYLLSRIFKGAEDPAIPPAPILSNGRKDSTFASRYYKAHFWDNIDLSDPRMIRVPPMVFFDKLKEYVTKWTYQQPDSLNAMADYLVSKAKNNPDMFKFIVWYITNHYETSEIMGLDAVFVHMVKTYYTPDKAFWVTASQLEKMRERADQLEPILIGKKAEDIALPDTSDVLQSLMHSINADYTVLVFWDFDCHHCQVEIPKLVKWYDSAKTGGSGIKVFAVETDSKDPRKWKDFIKKNNLDWINVEDPYNTSDFHHHYDVTSTPIIFVFDKNNVIIAKKIGVEELNKVIKHDIDTRPDSK